MYKAKAGVRDPASRVLIAPMGMSEVLEILLESKVVKFHKRNNRSCMYVYFIGVMIIYEKSCLFKQDEVSLGRFTSDEDFTFFDISKKQCITRTKPGLVLSGINN